MRRGLPATVRRCLVFTLLLAMGSACLSEPSGPFGHQLEVSPQSLTFAALGDTVRLSAAMMGPSATPLPTPNVSYASNAPLVASVDSAGLVTARNNGVTWIAARALSGDVDSVPVTVIQQPSGILASHDTLRFEALGEAQSLGASVVDRLGAVIPGLAMEYAIADTSVASVVADGRVYARRNGLTVVQITSAGESLQVVIQVQQRPVMVLTDSGSLRFVALGETRTIVGIAVDSLGHPVQGGGVAQLAVEDTSVLELVDSVTVRAKRNGRTVLRFSAAGLPVQQVGVVAQVPDTIVATLTDTLPILSLWRDSLIPLRCEVRDRNGQPMTLEPSVDASSAWSGSSCQELRAQHSALATLVVRVGSMVTALPVALAVRPVASSVAGEYLDLDSLPASVLPWAPTLWRSPSGDWQLFFAGYEPDNTSLSGYRGHLHRLVSNDGLHYLYDGVVLQRDDSDCAPNGSGIENIAIVPKSDAPGWRMYYASGSFACFGWQVFSAVSSDAQTWIKEPGIRLDNGGAPGPGAPPWPVGEGMVVEQMTTGDWRMLVGGYRRIQPAENKFHIVEWRSTDQVNWTYVGPVLTTDELPATGQRSAYSPTIREFAPGLWRMIFTADDLNAPGGRSRIWSAVSTNRTQWQLEGEIMGVVGTDLFYSTLIDDRLVFIRKEVGQQQGLATATVAMP